MPAIIPFIPAIIGAGASIGSSLINKSAAKKAAGAGGGGTLFPPGLDQNALTGLIGQQKDLSGFLTSTGKSTLGQGSDTLTGPLDFYKTILGGDRTALMQTLAPEVAQINAQFRQPLNEAALTGRGSALMPDLNAQKQSAISDLFFKERPAAADKLSAIAQGLMQLGTQQVGAGGSILGQAAGETLDYNSIIRGLQSQHANDKSNMLGSLGSSLGPILAGVLGGSKGSSGPATPGPPPIAMPPIDLAALISSSQGAPSINAGWLSGTGGKG